MVLDGFQLALPDVEVVRSEDPRAIVGQTITTDRGWISHGTLQLADRDTLEPLGTPQPVQPDGSFTLVPPAGVDGEVAIRFEADGFVPTYTFATHIRAGGRARVDTVARGGMELVHRLYGLDIDWTRPGMAANVTRTVGADPYVPVGCAVVSTEPHHPVGYTAGNGDSDLRTEPSTSPMDGLGVLFQPPPGPRTMTVTVGDRTESAHLPEIPPGFGTFVVLQLDGPDPTPPHCR